MANTSSCAKLSFSINALLTADHHNPSPQPPPPPSTEMPQKQSPPSLAECFPLIFGAAGVNFPFGFAQFLAKSSQKMADENAANEREDKVEEVEEEEVEEEGMPEDSDEEKEVEGIVKKEKLGEMDELKHGEDVPLKKENPLTDFPTAFPTAPAGGWFFPSAGFARSAPVPSSMSAIHPSHPSHPLLPPSSCSSSLRFPCLPAPSFGCPPSLLKSPLFPLFNPFSALSGHQLQMQMQSNQNGNSSGHHHHHHHQQHQQHKRKGGQIRFSNEQTDTLEGTFDAHKYLNNAERKRLARALALSERQVKTWFQNRRAKWRRQQPPDSAECQQRSPIAGEEEEEEDDDPNGNGRAVAMALEQQQQHHQQMLLTRPAIFGPGQFCSLSD